MIWTAIGNTGDQRIVIVSQEENFFDQSRSRKCDDLMIFTRLINAIQLQNGQPIANAHKPNQKKIQ